MVLSCERQVLYVTYCNMGSCKSPVSLLSVILIIKKNQARKNSSPKICHCFWINHVVVWFAMCQKSEQQKINRNPRRVTEICKSSLEAKELDALSCALMASVLTEE